MRANFERRHKLGRLAASRKADERARAFVRSRRNWEVALMKACDACGPRLEALAWRRDWEVSSMKACDACGPSDASGEKEQELGGEKKRKRKGGAIRKKRVKVGMKS